MSLSSRLSAIGSALTSILLSINTQLLAKGSNAASNLTDVPSKIAAIPTGITPTGTVQITQNGTTDVTQYASADVQVPNDDSELVGLIGNTLTTLENSNVTNVRSNIFYGSTTVRKIAFPNAVTMGTNDCFRGCTNLEEVSLPKVATSATNYAYRHFSDCAKLEKVDLSSWQRIDGSEMFYNCSKLEVLDLPKLNYQISCNNCFGNSGLKHLILRKNNGIISISTTGVFNNCPFRNGTGGTLYVPYALVSTYANATNWSSLESTSFASIEENLVALQSLGVNIANDYIIVNELPTTDIAANKVYCIQTQTPGTYAQWFYGSGSWEQLANITLEVSV